MTICIATSDYLPNEGGITTFNLHLSGLLVQAGHKVIILTVGYNADEADDDEVSHEGNGLIIVRLRKTYHRFLKKYTPYFKPGGFDVPNWIAMGYAMQEWLIKNKNEFWIDIIEASDYGGIGVFLCDAELPPVVITGHGSLLQYFKFSYIKKEESAGIVKQLELLSYQRADDIIAHSQLNQEDLAQLTGKKISLARIPYKAARPPAGQEQNEDGLVVAGMHLYKGPLVLANALRKIKDKLPGYKVKWIGTDSFMDGPHRSVASTIKNKYSDIWMTNFEWLQIKDHNKTIKEICNAGIIIIPSVWETFNYVALEAASMGKAIIITDKTGAAYLFTHRQNAFIIPADNDQALADAITRLQSDKNLCKYLGANASLLIEEQFAPDRIVEERMAIYKKVIANYYSKKKPENSLQFLDKYCTPGRKFYFRLRGTLKKIFRSS